MSMVAKRALSAALTVIGLVLVVVGAWFTVHLGSSGSATLRSTPADGALVVVEPSLLNRVDAPATVTAVAAPGTTIWMGRTTPSDAQAIVGRRRPHLGHRRPHQETGAWWSRGPGRGTLLRWRRPTCGARPPPGRAGCA